MISREQFVILSGELLDKTESENRRRTSNLFTTIGELFTGRAKPVIGYFKGTQEMSVLVKIQNQDELKVLKNLAFSNFGQDAVLHSDSQGNVWRVKYNGNEKLLGNFKEVDVDFLLKNNIENYTEIDGKYFTTTSEAA